jgi:ring-1,2-phenylacetyl-CoA epoxidase subunit PaaD
MSGIQMNVSIEEVYGWLEEVKDPEIPVLSLVDLGVITGVKVDGSAVNIEMTPTYVGCPALDFMKAEVVSILEKHGMTEVNIEVTFREAWTSDRISDKGRTALKEFGLAPPPSTRIFTDLEILEIAQCPRCDGTNTELKTLFGPTLCRAIYYCHNCKDAFEQFKPI